MGQPLIDKQGDMCSVSTGQASEPDGKLQTADTTANDHNSMKRI